MHAVQDGRRCCDIRTPPCMHKKAAAGCPSQDLVVTLITYRSWLCFHVPFNIDTDVMTTTQELVSGAMPFEIELRFGKASSQGYKLKATQPDYDDSFVKILLSTMASILGIVVDDVQAVYVASVDHVDKPIVCLAKELPGHLKSWLEKEKVSFGVGRRLLVTPVRSGGRSKAPARSRQSALSGAPSHSKSGMGHKHDGKWEELKSSLIHITSGAKAPFLALEGNARLSSLSLMCVVMMDVTLCDCGVIALIRCMYNVTLL